jgi:S-adenosylmethionine:tRNA ribosyltransferase-isomerase
VAAPTAGLHFTEPLLCEIATRGLERAHVVLHVGAGTFKPIESETLEGHRMHAEWCAVESDQAACIRRAKHEGRRVIAVGTTTARTLESHAPSIVRGEAPEPMETRLMIAPGHDWRLCDGLLTNFHLPRSTLLALVAAITPGGLDRVKALYAEAIEEGYRFFSYGDAMLILPGR